MVTAGVTVRVTVVEGETPAEFAHVMVKV